MIIPIYKSYGESTHQLAQKTSRIFGEKASHTGTLDPAAEGVVVVVTGEDRLRKEELASSTKVYQAQILFGISTDTHDLIGLPLMHTKVKSKVTAALLAPYLEKLTGTYQQTLPAFSAKRIAGGSYFDLARQSQQFEKETQEITVARIEVLSSIEVDISEVEKFHKDHLALIKGDFRQADIAQAWVDVYKADLGSLSLVTLSVTCSKRTYIRALVRDLSEIMNTSAVLYSLVRTHNGPYSIKDCLCLIPSSET